MAHAYHDQPNAYIKRELDIDQRQILTPGPSLIMTHTQYPPGSICIKREGTPDQYDFNQEQMDYYQQERQSTVDAVDSTTSNGQWPERTNVAFIPNATVIQNSMASSRYAQLPVQVDPSPASLNRMTSKRLLEDDSMDQMQYGGSPATKRRRHDNNFRGMKTKPSSSKPGIPGIKLEPMHRAPKNDVIEICKASTSGNLTSFEIEQLTEIQTKIDRVFNHGAKPFDILSELKSKIVHSPPITYGLSLKPEHNRQIGELQKRMKDAQTHFAAQHVGAEAPSTPRNRKIKKCRVRNAKSPSAPTQQLLPVENVIGMLKLSDESSPAVVQTANNLLASKNLKLTLSGGELRLIDLATQA